MGIEETLPIVSFLPMMMFAILFGLSMDYEVFILSRVREEFSRTGRPHDSVLTGLASSARVITAAALIMVSVFAAFVLDDDPIIKMFGVGLSAAVLLDATIVRMVLVPAVMTLFDKAAWWLPRWLDRLLPDIDIEGERLMRTLDARTNSCPDGDDDATDPANAGHPGRSLGVARLTGQNGGPPHQRVARRFATESGLPVNAACAERWDPTPVRTFRGRHATHSQTLKTCCRAA